MAPNIVFILVDNVGWGEFRRVRRNDTHTAHRQDGQRGHPLQQLQRRSAVHADALGHPYRAASGSLGDLHRPFSRAGRVRAGPVGIHHRRTPLRRWLCHRAVRQVALGEHEGRLPNDQGYDEWWGIKNSWDEAGYTAGPLFKESGMPAPMIWEGKKGETSKPVMPLDLKVRPIVDGKYIIPKTVEYIKRNAAAKKPFFVYVGYSEVHPPIIGQSGLRRQVHPARRTICRRHR